MKLKLSQMKKISSDATHTTMETKEGHTLRIAHNSLSKDHKKALEALPMLESKKIPNENPKLEESKKTPPKVKMADGGDVAGDQSSGDPTSSILANQRSIASAPTEAPAEAPQPQAPMAVDPAAAQAPQAAAPSMAAAQPGADPSQQAPTSFNPNVDLTKAYNTQIDATKDLARAEQHQIAAKADVLKTNIAAQQQVVNNIQEGDRKTQDELTGLRKAIADGHIDPDHYMHSKSTGDRIRMGIAVFLGGFGNGSNQVLDYVNKQIDNDIKGQQANLDNKQSLYSSILKQSENHSQALNMTRLAMNDMMLNKLEQSAASTSNPIIQARAKQGIAAIQAQMAPMIQQQAMYKMLQTAGTSGGEGLKNINPEELIPRMIPKEAHEAVFKEVERAQNSIKARDSMISNFDKLADQIQSHGGLGRIATHLYPPPERQALKEQLTTTTSDKAGTVREAATNAAIDAYVPHDGDTADRIATRRKEFLKYMDLQSAAPRFESYTHIPLSKFRSTSHDQTLSLSPQQKAYADYAKANPNAPGSQAVLKKLGLQ